MFSSLMLEAAIVLLIGFILVSIIGSIFSGTMEFFANHSLKLVIVLAVIVIIVSIAAYVFSKCKYASITYAITMVPASILLVCQLIEAVESLANLGGDILLIFGLLLFPAAIILYGIIFAIILLFAIGIPLACEYADSTERYILRNILIIASIICAVVFIFLAINSDGWQYILMSAKS